MWFNDRDLACTIADDFHTEKLKCKINQNEFQSYLIIIFLPFLQGGYSQTSVGEKS